MWTIVINSVPADGLASLDARIYAGRGMSSGPVHMKA